MIIADTTIVGEFMRDSPDAIVLTWAESIDPAELANCVVTVQEIERGLGRMPAGKRRASLEQSWQQLIEAFRDTVAVYDVLAARATAQILVDAEAGGHPTSLADAQIAGICVSNRETLATRNVRDFDPVGNLDVVTLPSRACPTASASWSMFR